MRLALILFTLIFQRVVSVPVPGPLTQSYQGQGIYFRYPQNWDLAEREGQLLVAPPSARIRMSNGSDNYSHGMFVGFFRPNWEVSVGRATDELIRSFQQANPGFQKVPNSENNIGMSGRNARTTGWVNLQAPLGPETGILIVVEEQHGYWWWLIFSPTFEFESYTSLFSAIAASIRFENEPEEQVEEHNEHADVVRRVVAALEKNQFRLPSFRVVISSQQEINAYAYVDYNLVVIPEAMVHFLHENEGELAFLIGHELGHLADKECLALRNSRGGRLTRSQSRECEARADRVGLQYLVGAGYNPFDAAAFQGRMIMFSGKTSILGNLWSRIRSTHPIDLDRIQTFRDTLFRYCEQYPKRCPSLGH